MSFPPEFIEEEANTAMQQQQFLPQLPAFLSACRQSDMQQIAAFMSAWPPAFAASAMDAHALFCAAQEGTLDDVKMLLLEKAVSPDIARLDGTTPLHAASFSGHVDVVEALLLHGPTLDAADANGVAPLHIAAMNDHVEIVKALLSAGAKIDAIDKDGCTPLLYASRHGVSGIASELLEHGADVDLPNAAGETPLSIAVGEGHSAIVNQLLAGGANVNAGKPDGWTPLHGACYHGFSEIAVALLEKNARIDAFTAQGLSPLHLAAFNGHVDVLHMLLKKSADLDAVDPQARVLESITSAKPYSPMMLACQNNHVSIVNSLLDHGDDIEKESQGRLSPLYTASQHGRAGIVETLIQRGAKVTTTYESEKSHPLYAASADGHVEIVNLLLHAGAQLSNAGLETPLHVAAKFNRLDVVDVLVTAGANIDAINGDRTTPLFIASFIGHVDMVHLFLNRGANVEIADGRASTPLHAAATNGHVAIVAALLASGANVDAADENNATPLFAAAATRSLPIVEKLLAHGANPNIPTASSKRTPLHTASINGLTAIVRALLHSGANCDILNAEGYAPLHMASFTGHLDTVAALLDGGAQVNFPAENGGTALFIASERGHVDVVKLLILHGANARSGNMQGYTPLYLASQNGCHDIVDVLLDQDVNVDAIQVVDGGTPLCIACQFGHLSVVKVLLGRGAQVNLAANEETPLYIASKKGHLAVVSLLLDHNAKPNIVITSNGSTPLYVAAQNGHTDVVSALLNRGAHVNAVSAEGATPLYIASDRGDVDVVNALLDHGAEVDFAVAEGLTSLYIACTQGNLAVVTALLDRGANVHMEYLNGSTPLFAACGNGHADIVSALLDRGANVNVSGIDGTTPLLLSSSRGHLDVASVLLQHGAIVDAASAEGYTSLFTASLMGHVHIVQTLLDHGANVGSLSADGQTPLHMASQPGVLKALIHGGATIDIATPSGVTPLFTACENGHLDAVNILIQEGARVDAANSHGVTPLYIASCNGHMDIVKILLHEGADANASTYLKDMTSVRMAYLDTNGREVKVVLDQETQISIGNTRGLTPLHVASFNGHVDVVQELLSGGAKNDIADGKGMTALHLAAHSGHLNTVDLLVARGANVNASSSRGVTPLHVASRMGHLALVTLLLQQNGIVVDAVDRGGETPLYVASKLGHSGVMKALLQGEADTDLPSIDGTSSLYVASKNGHLDAVRVLLESGASVNIADVHGATPLHVASHNGYAEIASILLRYGANVDSADLDGNVPLMSACERGYADVVGVLVGSQASLDAQNALKETPVIAAGDSGHFDIVKVLVEAGASMHTRSAKGETLLTLAAVWGCSDLVAVLAEHGGFAVQTASDIDAPPLFSTLQTLSEYGSRMCELQPLWNTVVKRLLDIYALLEDEDGVSLGVMQQFTMIIFRVAGLHFLHEETDMITRLIASRRVESSIQDFHTQIDQLLQAIEKSPAPSTIHSEWRAHVERERATLVGVFWSKIKDDEQLSASLTTKSGQTQAISLLRYEISTQSGTHSEEKLQLFESCLANVLRLSGVKLQSMPSWFLPHREVECTELDQSSSHDRPDRLYRGKWLGGTDVMIHEYAESRVFESAERWIELSHPNVVKFFGGDHLRDPCVAVFENATYTSLRAFLNADRSNRRLVWRRLHDVALGLKYLHEREIVVGTLDCDHIWIGTDGLAKIAGFELTSTNNGQQESRATPSCRWQAPEHLVGKDLSTASDIYSFGMCILEAVTGNDPWGDAPDANVAHAVKWGLLPPRPDTMASSEWRIIQGMCLLDPRKRVKIGTALDQLKQLAFAEHTCTQNQPPDPSEQMCTALHDYVVPELASSIDGFLKRLLVKCMSNHDAHESALHVHARLVDIYKHLTEMNVTSANALVARYCDILLSLDLSLRIAVSEKSVIQRAKSRKAALSGQVLHREIDELLDQLNLSEIDQTHSWQQRSNGSGELLTTNPTETSTDELNRSTEKGSEEQVGVVQLLRFESGTVNPKFTSAKFSLVDQTDQDASLPPWFIPIHELKYKQDECIGVGAFGAVYRGTWLGTPVVVKFMGYEADGGAYDLDMFQHELRVWYPLNHPHVVKLFGASHIGKRFFVCEYASNGSLRDFLERDQHRESVWQKLYELALGLQYLHEQNIVHNDLKCDNFLVGGDGRAKVTDFGLSCIRGGTEVKIDPKQQGAQQWKSPEYLRGERSTLASDIYSFGMSMLEAITGQPPWGTISDVFVRLKVRRGLLPARPHSMSDEQWSLIEAMCVHDPSRRLNISPVVDRLRELSDMGSAKKAPALRSSVSKYLRQFGRY